MEDGSIVDSVDLIMQSAQDYYTKLFTKDEVVEHNIEERKMALKLITTKVTEEENEVLVATPTHEEVNKVVRNMPTRKSPGLDGMTFEVLKKCWPFVGQVCREMIVKCWEGGEMTTKALMGVIKLVSKGDNVQLFTNWRPLSMLITTNKILGKILANRTSVVIPKLVDVQQTGFIKSRSIIDNVLAYHVGRDYSKAKKLRALLLKLDFSKAYDRVAHIYL